MGRPSRKASIPSIWHGIVLDCELRITSGFVARIKVKHMGEKRIGCDKYTKGVITSE